MRAKDLVVGEEYIVDFRYNGREGWGRPARFLGRSADGLEFAFTNADGTTFHCCPQSARAVLRTAAEHRERKERAAEARRQLCAEQDRRSDVVRKVVHQLAQEHSIFQPVWERLVDGDNAAVTYVDHGGKHYVLISVRKELES